MERNVYFTSERLTKKFKSNFDLVNYAIALAENKIRTGRDGHTFEKDNVVIMTLKDIEEGKDHFEPIPVPSFKTEQIAKTDKISPISAGFEEEKEELAIEKKKGRKKVVYEEDEE